MSTNAGDLPILNFKEFDADGGADSVPDRVFCALNCDCVLNVQDSGIQVLDWFSTNKLMNKSKKSFG